MEGGIGAAVNPCPKQLTTLNGGGIVSRGFLRRAMFLFKGSLAKTGTLVSSDKVDRRSNGLLVSFCFSFLFFFFLVGVFFPTKRSLSLKCASSVLLATIVNPPSETVARDARRAKYKNRRQSWLRCMYVHCGRKL